MSEQYERTDKQVAQYLHPDSWLFRPTVRRFPAGFVDVFFGVLGVVFSPFLFSFSAVFFLLFFSFFVVFVFDGFPNRSVGN